MYLNALVFTASLSPSNSWRAADEWGKQEEIKEEIFESGFQGHLYWLGFKGPSPSLSPWGPWGSSILPSVYTHIHTWCLVRGSSLSQTAGWERHADLQHSRTFLHCPPPPPLPRAGANTAWISAFFKQLLLPKPTPEWKYGSLGASQPT